MSLDLWLFQIIKVIPLLLLFAYAAYSDYKTGEVSNKVWLWTPGGFALTLIELYMYTPTLAVFTFVSMGVLVAISLGLFFFSKGLVGAADSKALVMLSLCLPFSPVFCLYAGLFPLLAFVLAAFLVALKFFASRGRGGLRGKVRFLPYLFIGLLLALI